MRIIYIKPVEIHTVAQPTVGRIECLILSKKIYLLDYGYVSPFNEELRHGCCQMGYEAAAVTLL